MSDRNTLQVVDGDLIVSPRGLDKMWGFRRQIAIPLQKVDRVEVEQKPHRVRRGLRAPGLDVCWKRCGTFHSDGERHYWNQSGSGALLVVYISGGAPFDRLYLSVADPASARKMLIGEAKLDS